MTRTYVCMYTRTYTRTYDSTHTRTYTRTGPATIITKDMQSADPPTTSEVHTHVHMYDEVRTIRSRTIRY